MTGIINTDTVTKQYWIKATDLNNVATSGYYKFTGGPANTPCHSSGDYGMLIVSTFDNYITQLCHKYAFYPGLYTRSSSDSGVTWSAWSDVPTTMHYDNDQSASMNSFPAGKVTFWASAAISDLTAEQWVSVQTDYFKADGTRKRQVLMGGSDGKTRYRYYNGTTWSSWATIS